MKQRDLFQFAPAVSTEGAAPAETFASPGESSPAPTWPEAKWDDQGELVFAE
jgi:hypothetical protein